MRAFSGADWEERNRAHTNRADVFTTPERWPDVEATLLAAGVTPAELAEPHRTERYGLVRLALDPRHDVDRRTLGGLNYLVGFGAVELDQDVVGQPKVIGSALDDLTPTSSTLPPRVVDGPGTGVTVGVVDTGFRRHKWIRGACTYQADDLEQAGPEPISGHGLFAAGLILEHAPGATVRMERVLSTDGHGEAIDVHDAICRLAIAGAQIINLSLGCYTANDTAPLVLQHAIEWARAYQTTQRRRPEDIVFVAAAGNLGSQPGDVDPARPFWPAALDGVWAIASAEPGADGSWTISDFSARADWVNAAAPGRTVVSTWTPLDGRATEVGGSWASWSGTSFAAAVASGVLAATYAQGSDADRLSLGQVGTLPAAATSGVMASDAGVWWPVLGASTIRA